MRVLVAEDDPTIRSLVLRTVERLGYECLQAEDGDEAWTLFQAAGADTIVSDWLMPGLQGPELCRRVRAAEVEGQAPYTYFILLTALDDVEHALGGMQAGADEYLRKPFDRDELRRCLVAARRVTDLHRQLARTAARREAVLRASRRLASEGSVGELMTQLLTEAMAVTGGHGATIYYWDAAAEGLRVGRSTLTTGGSGRLGLVRTGEGAAGMAIEQRQPEVLNNYAASPAADPALVAIGVTAALAAPLLHDGRLLGAIEAVCKAPDTPFSAEDASSLELLAGVASAAMVGQEQAWLGGIYSAARLAQQELATQIAQARGAVDRLLAEGSLPAPMQQAALSAVAGAESAAAILDQLRQITHADEPMPTLGDVPLGFPTVPDPAPALLHPPVATLPSPDRRADPRAAPDSIAQSATTVRSAVPASTPGPGSAVEVTLGPVAKFTELAALTRAIRALPGVEDVTTRQFFKGTAVLRVRYDNPIPLEQRLLDLADFTPRVTTTPGGRIDVRITPSNEPSTRHRRVSAPGLVNDRPGQTYG